VAQDVQAYDSSIFIRLLTSFAALSFYVGHMIWPVCLHFPRTYPVFQSLGSWQVLAGAALAAGALTIIILGKGQRRIPLTFGFLWFVAAFSPYSGILVPTDYIVSEGWMYMPTAGLALGVSQAAALRMSRLKFKKAPLVAAAAVALVALLLGVKTHFQNRYYHDMGSFFKHNIDCGEDLGLNHNNLGIYYLEHERFDEAIEQFRAIDVHAGVETPHVAGMYLNLAMAYLRVPEDKNGIRTVEAVMDALPHTQQIPEAVAALKKSLEYDPNLHWSRKFLDIVEAYQKQQADIYAAGARYRMK
jgi:tetratricopeptide (TPR) repeat protein